MREKKERKKKVCPAAKYFWSKIPNCFQFLHCIQLPMGKYHIFSGEQIAAVL